MKDLFRAIRNIRVILGYFGNLAVFSVVVYVSHVLVENNHFFTFILGIIMMCWVINRLDKDIENLK